MSTFTATRFERAETRDRVAALWADTEIPVTLDGHRAVITGFAHDFATVHTIGSPSYGVEWSWASVERVMLRAVNPGAFRS